MNFLKTSKSIHFIILSFLIGSCSTKEEKVQVQIDLLDTPVSVSFRGLHAIDENTVWLSGSKGTYMRTVDGGATWDYGSFLDSVDFRSIHGFDSERAIMISAGMPAVIYKTEDGGKNWSLKYKNEDPRVFFDAVGFWDDLNGIAFSDSFDGRFFMILTSDGGNTWSQLLSAPEASEGEGGFAASGTNMIIDGSSSVWLGTTTGRILYSDNRGVSWESVLTPLENSAPAGGIFSVAISGERGLLVGGNYEEPNNSNKNSALLENGKWIQAQSTPTGFRSAVAFIPQSTMAITTGTSGTDLSYDAGMNWTSIDSLGYHAISFGKNSSSGWMSGGNGRVAKIKLLE